MREAAEAIMAAGPAQEATSFQKSKIGQLLFVLARLGFASFVVMSSFYCLLAFIPFTYQWMIRNPLVASVTGFARIHPYLYWISLAVLTTTLLGNLRSRRAKRLTLGFLVFHIGLGLLLSFSPVLVRLSNDHMSVIYSLVALFPLTWVAAIDRIRYGQFIKWETQSRSHPTFVTLVLAACFVAVVYLTFFYFHFVLQGTVGFRLLDIMAAGSWSAATHVVVFIIVFGAIRGIRAISACFSEAMKVEFLLSLSVLGLLVVIVLRGLVFPALSFTGTLSLVYSLALAFALLAYTSGLSLIAYRSGRVEISSGLDLALAPLLMLAPRRTSSWLLKALWLLALVTGAYLLRPTVVGLDWGFVVQKMFALALWALVFSFFYSVTRRQASPSPSALVAVLISVSCFVIYRAVDGSGLTSAPALRDGGFGTRAAVDKYADYDVSFSLAREILSTRGGMGLIPAKLQDGIGAVLGPDTAGSVSATRAGSFYEFLRKNTNLQQSVVVKPVDIALVDNLSPGKGDTPHIFIFIIDSLRQDYLSPYNKAVSFTPAIERFARESFVMQNAFTRYSGTVLAEPAVWAGAMQLHKQYIEPFYPMNTLQKLLEAEGYDSFITMDPVLEIVVRPSSTITKLDAGLLWFQYDLCRSLQELREKIDTRAEAGRPVFVYIQPQNLHTIVLTNHRPVPPGSAFPGFYEHYASQVRRIDQCFGDFIDYLKARGIYDDSIVILTSDHGDSMNESGRWGHSYWLFPEIIRIPLVIRLPLRMQRTVTVDTKSIAFSTDITPTLYYLLGHRPIKRNSLFGRPLFTVTRREQEQYARQAYLIASSYAPVYGILTSTGRSLFIADGVNEKEYLLRLEEDFTYSEEPLTPEVRTRFETHIRDAIQDIADFYGLREP